MRLTKERKAYVAIFGIGLVALAADRLWFTPAGASAAATTAEPAPPATEAAAEVKAAPPAQRSFGDRLLERALWEEGPLWDAFVAPPEWGGLRAGAAPDQPEPEQADFAKSHRLTAVFKSPQGNAAIVDGHVVRRGDVVDGYTMVDCENSKDVRAAEFERDGVRVRIVVPERNEPNKSDKGPR